MNRRNGFLMVMGMIVMSLAVGCTSVQAGAADMVFEAQLTVGVDQALQVSLAVRNAGQRTFRGDKQFRGQMEIRDRAGDLSASAEVLPLPAIEPGETVWPLGWEGELAPGDYRLSWGADDYGFTAVEFAIVERGGRLYLANDAPPEPSATPAGLSSEEDALVAQAIADLQARLDVEEDQITVESVEPRDYSDASLGVPEPGQMYAQVVTPGVVIRLSAAGTVYEYRAADERVVLLPMEADGPSASYRPVEVADLGLTFEVPANWRQLGSGLAWAPGGEASPHLAFNWVELPPPNQIEAAMLPSPAQILSSEPVTLPWGEGRRFKVACYGSSATDEGEGQMEVEAVHVHVLFTHSGKNGRLGLDFYAVAESDEELARIEPVLQHLLDSAALAEPTQATIEPALSMAPEDIADWQPVASEAHGVQFSIPQDWAIKELPQEGPGMPDDWPIEWSAIVFPQAWSERFEQGGPPDPEAPPSFPALLVEVCVGPEAQLQRVHLPGDEVTPIAVNGVAGTQEETALNDQIRQTVYVFRHPADPNVHVIVSDAINGFAERVVGNEAIAARVPQIVATLTFAE